MLPLRAAGDNCLLFLQVNNCCLYAANVFQSFSTAALQCPQDMPSF
jgi:hypothetical protein